MVTLSTVDQNTIMFVFETINDTKIYQLLIEIVLQCDI